MSKQINYGSFMFDFEQTKQAIESSQQLNQEDIAFLCSYHQWQNAGIPTSDEETERLEAEIGKKINDRGFNRRLAAFEGELRTRDIEFPYLDVLKKRQVYAAIENSQHLSPVDKEFFSLYHKSKSEPEKINASDTLKLEGLIKRNWGKAFNLRFYRFEKELRVSKIEFPYLDVFKKKQIDLAIENSTLLTQDDKEFFAFYHKGMNKENEMSDEEKERLSEELMKKINDSEFRKKLSTLQKEMKEHNLVFPYLDTLVNYSFGLLYDIQIDNLIKNVKRLTYVLSKGGALDDDEKLTLAELGLIKKLIDLQKSIHIFTNEKGITLNSEQSKKLENQCAKIESLNDNIKTLYERELYQSGDVLVTDMDKTHAFQLEHTQSDFYDKGRLFNFVKRRFTKYGHASQLTEIGGEIKQSHLWGTHLIDPFGFENIGCADIFRFNVSKLVSQDQEAGLQTIFGENWRQALQNLYAEKVAEVSQSTALSKARIISGFNAVDVIYPHWYGRKDHEYLGLFSQSNTHLYKDRMVCSDFVAREISEAIRLINRNLQEQGLNIPIRSPFPHYVNLSRVHPEELIVLLEKSGCLDRVEPKQLNTLVNTSNHYKLLARQENLIQALYDKVFYLAQRCKTEEDFLRVAILAFKGYVHSNNLVNSDISEENLDTLDQVLIAPLKVLYQQHHLTETVGFLRVFRDLFSRFIHFLGIKNAQSVAIIEDAVKQIHIQPDTTRSTAAYRDQTHSVMENELSPDINSTGRTESGLQ